MFPSTTISRARTLLKARPRAAAAAMLLIAAVGTLAGFAVARGGDGEPRLAVDLEPRVPESVMLSSGQPAPPPPLPKPTTVVTFEQGCASARCHSTINEQLVVHIPASQMACQTCHLPDAGGHTFPLRGEKTALCTSCHTIASHRPYHHDTMTEDGCVSCHNPHGSSTPGLLRAATLQETCAACHPNAEGSSSHPPYATGRCDVCHDPHGGDNRPMLLTGEGQQACVSCHAAAVGAVNKGPHTGIPRPEKPHATPATGAELLRSKSCIACHPPHAGSHDGLLAKSTRELCAGCHATIGSVVSSARFTHDAVLKGHQCVTCHDPHGSGQEHSLRDAQPKLCLTCHDKPQKAHDGRQIQPMTSIADAKVVHGAIREGDCSSCHSVHGSENARLLGQLDPSLLADPHAAANYTLCFSCHDSSLARPGPTTMFRDGDTNLHELHLRPGEKSARGCASCHAVHASDLPRLIARSVNFEGSGWSMPMGFEVTPDGGRCDSACHEPLSYSRRPGGIRALKKEGAP
ncbi:MAG: hypothetical protein AMXMBFR58_35820 [Phycisphaerae bacterium]